MTKLEKVIKGLECHLIDEETGFSCGECPYQATDEEQKEIDWNCHWDLMRNDALELLKERQWISVKDRLPENGATVLISTPKGRMRVARVTVPHQKISKKYDPLEAWWWMEGFNRSLKATHWMPMPKAPERPKEGEIDANK